VRLIRIRRKMCVRIDIRLDRKFSAKSGSLGIRKSKREIRSKT